MAQETKIVLNAQDNASSTIQAVQARIKAVKTESVSTSEGVKKLGDGFKELGKELLGAQGAAGNFAEALMAFGGGGLVVAGAVAGIGLIVTAFMGLKKAQDDVKASLNNYRLTLAAFRGDEAKEALTQANDRLLDENRKSGRNSMLMGVGIGLQQSGNPILGAIGAFTQTKGLEGYQKLTDANAAYNTALKRVLDLQKQKEEQDKKDAEATSKSAKATRDKADAEAMRIAQEELKLATERKANAVASITGGAKGLIEYQKAYGSLTPDQLDTLNFLMRGLKTQEAAALNSGDFGAAAQFKSLQTQLEALKPQVDSFKMITGMTQAEFSVKLTEDLNKSTREGFVVNEDALNAQLSSLNNMEDILNRTTDAWFSMWSAIGSGVSPLRAIGQAFVQSIVAYSGKKAAENIALGFENLAKAASSLANPLTAFLAPGFKSAASGHFVAAAKWAAIGGAGAAAGGALGGGGGGGGAGSTAERTQDSTSLGRGEANIIIQGGLLDMSNPEQARSLSNALEQLSGRRVTIMRG